MVRRSNLTLIYVFTVEAIEKAVTEVAKFDAGAFPTVNTVFHLINSPQTSGSS